MHCDNYYILQYIDDYISISIIITKNNNNKINSITNLLFI